ncbi:hypothetical protein EsHS_00003806 [Epichloe bromicola]
MQTAMSEELRDEMEAINSIYGDGSLTLAEDGDDSSSSSSPTYILKLPGDASSLRMRFPASYPSTAPVVLGTHHSSGGVRGAGARDAALFRSVVGEVFRQGEVCLFDGMEEFWRRRVEERGGGGGAVEEEEKRGGGGGAVEEEKEEEEEEEPAWTVSEVVVENKSTFVAREGSGRDAQHLGVEDAGDGRAVPGL